MHTIQAIPVHPHNTRQASIQSVWRKPSPTRYLVWGVWVYFFLLIFEGALRKWFLPGLATPLIIVRDPIALWVLIGVWQKHLLRATIYSSGAILAGVLGTITAVLIGHGNLYVALFGARIFLIHIPFIFAIGCLFTHEDVMRLGRVVLWLTPPMTMLIVMQFYSPQSAWVNRGVGGDMAGAGFGGALDYFRPPATFSFTNGTTLFFGFAACYVLYFWLSNKPVNRLLLICATVGLMIAVPTSISRGLMAHVLLSVLFGAIAVSRKPVYLTRLIGASIVVVLLFTLLGKTSTFQTTSEAFLSRFESANEQAGGVQAAFLDRVLGGLYSSLANSTEQPFFGFGIGMGTNVGSQLLSGERNFLIAEEEWSRIIGELGPLLGLWVVFLRIHLTFKLLFGSYKRLREGDLLPWMLLSFGFFPVFQGNWAQPTSLGFCTLIGGLIVASFNQPRQQVPTNRIKRV